MTKTNKPQIKIVNCETGEEILRDATAEEIAQIEADQANHAIRQAETESKAAHKQQILDKLGLTADEARLLLG